MDDKQLSVTVDNIGKVLFDSELEIDNSTELLIKGLMLQILSIANNHGGPKYAAFKKSLRTHMETAHKIYHDEIEEEDFYNESKSGYDPFN